MRKSIFSSRSMMLFIGLMTLSGCATAVNSYDSYFLDSHNRVKYNYQVGTTSVAVLSVTPWNDVVDTLKPNFEMDANKALAGSIPTTMRYEQRMIDLVLARLGAALPSTSTTSSATTTESSATGISSTSTSTRDKKPGDVGVVKPETSQSSLEPPAISGKSAMEGDIGLDPLVKYTAANALFQEVKLLNRYVADAAVQHDAKAYIVRLQVSVMPNKRNMPYDTYMNIAFNIPDAKGREESPIIIPLLVTDDLESLASSRSTETVLQLGMALSGMVNGIGMQGDLEKSLKSIKNFRGQSMNSLMTIARVTDNTLRVRLGAMQQGSSLYGVVPRTHNISVLLFVPHKLAKKSKDSERSTKISTLTRFRDTVTGEELADSPGYTEWYKEIKGVLETFRFDSNPENIELASNMLDDLTISNLEGSREKYSKLTQPSSIKPYEKRKNKGCYKLPADKKSANDNEACEEEWLTDFSNYLIAISVGGVTQYVPVSLPKINDPSIPNQTVLAFDDNKEIAVLVNGVKGIDVKDIESAKLKINDMSLEPTAIAMTETNELKLTYSSLSKLKLDKKYDGTQCNNVDSLGNLALRVKLHEDEKESDANTPEPSQNGKNEKEPATSSDSRSTKKVNYMKCTGIIDNTSVDCDFKVCYLQTDPPKKNEPQVKMAISATQIIAKKDGSGTIVIEFKLPTPGKDTVKYKLVVGGATVVKSLPDSVMELKDLIIKTDGKVTIELGNLSPDAPVNFKVVSADKNSKTDAEETLKVKLFGERE